MTRQKAFMTAAARRRANPIEWIIDEETVRLRSSVDLSEIADLLEALQTPAKKGESEIRAASEKRKILLDVVRTFVLTESVEAFDRVAPDLDFLILSDMVQELIAEYTGQGNPTQASSSSTGSSETGSSSTAGASPEE